VFENRVLDNTGLAINSVEKVQKLYNVLASFQSLQNFILSGNYVAGLLSSLERNFLVCVFINCFKDIPYKKNKQTEEWRI